MAERRATSAATSSMRSRRTAFAAMPSAATMLVGIPLLIYIRLPTHDRQERGFELCQ